MDRFLGRALIGPNYKHVRRPMTIISSTGDLELYNYQLDLIHKYI